MKSDGERTHCWCVIFQELYFAFGSVKWNDWSTSQLESIKGSWCYRRINLIKRNILLQNYSCFCYSLKELIDPVCHLYHIYENCESWETANMLGTRLSSLDTTFFVCRVKLSMWSLGTDHFSHNPFVYTKGRVKSYSGEECHERHSICLTCWYATSKLKTLCFPLEMPSVSWLLLLHHQV